MLTAADQPDAAAIEAKLREIEKIKSDARLAFVRAVGEAANVHRRTAKDGPRYGADAGQHTMKRM